MPGKERTMRKSYEEYKIEEYTPILESMNKDSQCYKILNHMLSQPGYTISPQIALYEYGCFRLAARIADLRKMGIEIHSKMVKPKEGNRYAIYWIGGKNLW